MVEVLLALAIGGLVLTAATSLLITISNAWANRPATRDAFDAHVNGVANFLSAIIEEATLPTLVGQVIMLWICKGQLDILILKIHSSIFLREGRHFLYGQSVLLAVFVLLSF